jgi:hypothetical protein
MTTNKSQLRDLVFSALHSRDLESAHAFAQQLKDLEDAEHPERENIIQGRLRSVDHVKFVFSCKPLILENVSDETLEHLRFAAGVSSLLGVTRFRDYLPAGMKTGLAMDNDSAVRMILFRAANESDRARARLSNAPRVRLVAANWGADFWGVCDYCKGLHGEEWALDAVPEIPLKHCTSKFGCRCIVECVW